MTPSFRLRDFSPAGGLCTSPEDLSKWLTFLLGNGTTEDGLTLIDKDVFDEMFQSHVSIPESRITRYSVEKPFPVSSSASWYGYAWFGRQYRGKAEERSFLMRIQIECSCFRQNMNMV